MNCGEAIEVLKKFPKDKQLMIMGWYSIVETDIPEEINEIDYLKEVDYNTLEVKGEIKYFVAIVSDKYHEIASEFPYNINTRHHQFKTYFSNPFHIE